MKSMTTVFYSEKLDEKFLNKIREELRTAFKGCKKIAIKIHFGEPGNKYAFVPEDIKPITNILKDVGLDFFLFDSSVRYNSIRANPLTHKKYAIKKGWGELGEIVTNDEFITVKAKMMDYEVCKTLADADGVLVISHVKGHVCSGFGGAIKNLGMGALTPKSKGDIHSGASPVFSGECKQCRACELACPMGTLKVTADGPEFGLCFSCSDCIYACPEGLIKPRVAPFDYLLAEGASCAQKKFKKEYYISYLTNIVKLCDCNSDPGKLIAKDSGFLASSDIVAIDAASHDIITKKAGEDVFLKFNKKGGMEQVQEAEKLGMGSSKYNLVKT